MKLLQHLTLLLAALLLAAPASGAATPDYVPVTIGSDGAISDSEMKRAIAQIKASPATRTTVLIHGFNIERRYAARSYRQIANRFNACNAGTPLRSLVVGVHWDSTVGSLGKWLPKALGHRLTSLLGLKKAVANPYLAKVEDAHEAGRQGLRQLLLELKAQDPKREIDVLAHSLGAGVVLAALSPEIGESGKERKIHEPGAPIKLGVVGLLGADVDRDIFARKDLPQAREALDSARVWWITVPDEGHADGILELRRGAGRTDALGNKGMALRRADYDTLLGRRGLVVEHADIPTWHDLADYFSDARCRRLTASLLYLQAPEHKLGQSSILARLDEVLIAERDQVALFTRSDEPCVRMYAGWRESSLEPTKDGEKEPDMLVAGSQQELRGKK